MRPSRVQTTIFPSAASGGPATSVETFTFHRGLPVESKAKTSPLAVPTATTVALAPTPAESGFSVLMRQFCRPVAGSTLMIVPSGAAA